MSDATKNEASWLQKAASTVPVYMSGESNRVELIQEVTDGIRARLSTFPITVVTQRPSAGPYMMIVFGGTMASVGGRFGGADMALDCGDDQKSDLGWIAEGPQDPVLITNYAMGTIGFGLGLSATADPLDCMCGWENTCQQDESGPCTLSATIARDPSANELCPGLTTQSESTMFDAFCH